MAEENVQGTMDKELRAHKSSFIVFSILRFFGLVILVRQLFMAHYEAAFFCILPLCCCMFPSWVRCACGLHCPRRWRSRFYASSLPQKFWENERLLFSGAQLVHHAAYPERIPCPAAVGFSLVLLLNDATV
jgi:hypothetical protein